MEVDYDDNRNPAVVRFGEASAGRQPQNIVHVLCDERDKVYRETHAPGTAEQTTLQIDYDPNGNWIRVLYGIEVNL